ncbi:subtilisin-like protease SBT1.4 [Papaver somniferum]|uniref:subtilisin-like protease SBT1.4 n=1 Tax=Papaver somniferum TaxID=3469 RepID=UPI000E6F6923|nr:subtilisin-like protease SBT1.4 [Papaver somniferum]
MYDSLRDNSGLSAASIRDDNVIIGVIDRGIWTGHPSFNDSMLTPAPERWKGICKSGPNFPESSCNRKIIGARAFWNGHRAKLEGIAVSTNAVGQAKGVVNRARIVVYKVCWNTGFPESDILVAMDQAVADGVDIIS